MNSIAVIGAGLAGSEAALQLATHSFNVSLFEARPHMQSPVHKTRQCAELVCSNSLKSENADSAAGMLKTELSALGSILYSIALDCRVPAGGALAVDRDMFSHEVTKRIMHNSLIEYISDEVVAIDSHSRIACSSNTLFGPFDAIILATGPLTSGALSSWLSQTLGQESLAFYDAAAPIVFADSLDLSKVFSQSRYEQGSGDYLNAPFDKDEYYAFIEALIGAKRIIAKDFETKELFQACQPIEEIARKSADAPRFGALKPVGLIDPRTGKRPWAAVQLRAEDTNRQAYNLVGFQTNLTFSEQTRVFRLIPGLEHAEFARWGVMHRNTFLDAPRCMDSSQRIKKSFCPDTPLFLAGQVSGTEGYCEAIRSGLQAAIEVALMCKGMTHIDVPDTTVYGALLAYASDKGVKDYQPMHVNFGIIAPLAKPIRNKKERYHAYSLRALEAIGNYRDTLIKSEAWNI